MHKSKHFYTTKLSKLFNQNNLTALNGDLPSQGSQLKLVRRPQNRRSATKSRHNRCHLFAEEVKRTKEWNANNKCRLRKKSGQQHFVGHCTGQDKTTAGFEGRGQYTDGVIELMHQLSDIVTGGHPTKALPSEEWKSRQTTLVRRS